MIKNIVFDMGQVLIPFDPDHFIDDLKLTHDEDRIILKNEVFRSIEWVKTDHGSMTDHEAYLSIIARLPSHLHAYAFKLIMHWYDQINMIPGMKELVQLLYEKGYSLYLLSNAGFNQPKYWKKLEIHSLFSGTMISADVGLMKPDHRIYDLFIDRFNLKADECIFIDDNPMNAEAAICRGWQAIVFNGNAAMLREQLITKEIL